MQNETSSSPERPPAGWKAKWAELFGIDVRSLATFRIAMGVLLLVDLAGRIGDLRAMLLNEGIMPIAPLGDWYAGRWRWSLHWLYDSVAYQSALFLVAAILAVALLLGYRTRWATIGSWLLLCSLHTRAPLIINGGDLLLRILLFWGMFLPLGRAVSWDARRRRGPSTGGGTVLSVATAAVLIQIAGLYFCASMFKWLENWNEVSPLYQALAWGVYNRPFGDFLLGYPDVAKALSFATLGLQMIGPLLLFVPWCTARFRMVVIGAFVSFHIGIELSMHVALFSYVAIAAWTLFLPSAFWESRFVRACGRWWPSRRPPQIAPAAYGVSTRAPTFRPFRWLASALCVACLLFVITYNVFGFFKRYERMPIPAFLERIGEVTLLTQTWNMFARPPTATGWYVAHARLKNGDHVDLLRDGAPVDWNRPLHLAQLAPNHRWRKFTTTVSLYRQPKANARLQPFRQAYAEYLFRDWNAQHDESQQIVVLDLVCVYTPADRDRATETQRRIVDARIESPDVPLEETINFDLP